YQLVEGLELDGYRLGQRDVQALRIVNNVFRVFERGVQETEVFFGALARGLRDEPAILDLTHELRLERRVAASQQVGRRTLHVPQGSLLARMLFNVPGKRIGRLE